jgi:hypothetical protein
MVQECYDALSVKPARKIITAAPSSLLLVISMDEESEGSWECVSPRHPEGVEQLPFPESTESQPLAVHARDPSSSDYELQGVPAIVLFREL